MKTIQKLALACATGVVALAGVAAVPVSPAPTAPAAQPVGAPESVQEAAAERIRASVAGLVAANCGTNAHASVIAAPGTPREAIDKVLTRIEEGYYGEVDRARFQPVDRWGGTGGRGNPVSLTYSFPPDGITIGNDSEGPVTNELFSRLNSIFGSQEVWLGIFDEEFDRWAAVTGVTYQFVADDGATWLGNAPGAFNGGSNRGDVRIVMGRLDGPSNVLAFNSFPDDGDMFMDVDENWGAGAQDFFFRNVITHEHGHGMGLAHTCPSAGNSIAGFPILMKPFIDTGFLGPQFDDRLSMHWLYGDRFEPNSTGPSSVNLPAMGQTNNGLPITIQEASLHSGGDLDLYRFVNFSGTTITVFVEAVGPTYDQGPQNGGGGSGCVGASVTEFDASAVGDIVVEVLQDNFATEILVNNTGAGGDEFIGSYELPIITEPETWYVRVSSLGTFSRAQMYNITVTTQGGGIVGNPADFSGDGCVDSTDLAIILANWGGPDGDLDDDGTTGSGDLAILLAAWTGPGC